MYRAPDSVHAIADAALRGQSQDLAETFSIRLDRWWADLRDGLLGIYPDGAADRLAERLIPLAAKAFAERDPELRRLDAERTLAPDWFQQPRMLGYAAYADRFAGTLAGVQEKIPYLQRTRRDLSASDAVAAPPPR